MQQISSYSPYTETNNIIVAGIILIVYEAMILITYYVLSIPGVAILQGIININSVPELATYGGISLTVFDMMFALAFMIPIVWFFVWIYRTGYMGQFRRFY